MNMEKNWPSISYKHFMQNEKVPIPIETPFLLYTHFHEISKTEWEHYLNLLPKHLIDEVNRNHFLKDRFHSLFSKLLVFLGYKIITGTNMSLYSYKRNSKGKPYIEDNSIEFEFSISHSGNIVGCVFDFRKIGFDTEEIKDIDLVGFENVFSAAEKWSIRKKGNNEFYRLWTMKEAVTKALGEGIVGDLSNLVVTNGKVKYKNCFWYPEPFLLQQNSCSIVHSNHKKNTAKIYVEF